MRAGLVVAAVALVAGCAGGGDGTADGTGGAASPMGGVTGSGGSTGVGGAGTGGAFVAGPGSTTFTRADMALCEDWPVCPDGIVAPTPVLGGFVRDNACPLKADGIAVMCGGCVDIRNSCAIFVGRCKAPIRIDESGGQLPAFLAFDASSCRQFLSDPFSQSAGHFAICTGDGVFQNSAAQTVCGDVAP